MLKPLAIAATAFCLTGSVAMAQEDTTSAGADQTIAPIIVADATDSVDRRVRRTWVIGVYR